MNTIQNKGKWNEISATLNDNFNLIAAELMKLGDAAYKAKGFFNTADDLVDAYPSSPDGSYAYVGSQAPYTLYKMNNGLWESTTQNVTIEEALDSIFDWSTIPSADEETRGLMTSAHVNLLNNIKELSETQEIEIDNIKKIIEEGVGGGGGSVTIVDASQITDAANDNKNLSEINTEMYDRLNDLEKIDPNGGLVRDYKGLKVKAGLGVRASSQGISVNAGKGLVTNIDDGYISVSAKEKGGIDVTSDGLSVSVGEGLSISEKNQVTVNLGTGLMLLEDNDIVLNISKGLTFSDKGSLTISTSKGLSTNEDGSIGIALANNSGLEFEGDNIRINEDIVNLPSLLDEAIETLGAEDEAINKRIDSLESGSVNLKPQSNKIYDSVNGDTYNDATAESNVYVYKGAPQNAGSISNDVTADVNIQTHANAIDIVCKSWGTKDWNTRARLKPATSGAAGLISAEQFSNIIFKSKLGNAMTFDSATDTVTLKISSSIQFVSYTPPTIQDSPLFVATKWKVNDTDPDYMSASGLGFLFGRGLFLDKSDPGTGTGELNAYPLSVKLGKGLSFSGGDNINVEVGTGLQILENNDIVVRASTGLIATEDGIAIDTKITDDIKYNLDLIGELDYKYSELEGTVGELENRKLETEGKSIVITNEGKIKLKFSGTKGLAEDDNGLKVAVDDNYFKFNDKGLLQISTDLGLSDSIQAVNDRITDVEDGAEASIGDLSKRLDDIETYGSRLDTLEGNVSGFTNQISSLQIADTRIDGVLTEHGKSIASNTNSIATLEDSFNGLSSTQETQGQNINQLMNTVNDVSFPLSTATDGVLKLKYGNGLYLKDKTLSVKLDSDLSLGEDGISVALGTGLKKHTDGKIVTSIASGLTFSKAGAIQLSTSSGFTMTTDGKLKVSLADNSGLVFKGDSIALKEEITTLPGLLDEAIETLQTEFSEEISTVSDNVETVKTRVSSLETSYGTISSTQETQGQTISQLNAAVNEAQIPLSTATDGKLKLKYGGGLGVENNHLVVKISTKKGIFSDSEGFLIGIDEEYFKFAESGALQMSTDFNSASLYSQLTSVKTDVSSVKTDVSSVKTDVSSVKSDVSSLKNNQLGYDGSSLNKSSDNKLYVQENGLIDNGVVGLNICLGTTMIRNSSAWSYSDDNLSSPLYVSTHARNNPNGSASGLGIAIGGSIKLGTSETFKGQTVSPIEVKTGEGLTYNSNGAVSVHVGQTFRKVGYYENDEGETEMDVQVYGSASPFIVSSVENRETINGTIVNGFGIALGEGLGIDRSDHIYINDKEVGFLTIAVGAGLKLEDGRLRIDENYIKSLING